MGRKYKIIIAVAALVYVVYHLATLIYSPLPWFDEVSFTSITNSYLRHHTYYEEARIIVLPQQKLDYGPVYFIMQAAIVKILGFGIFNFRISNLLFGFIDLFLVYEICRHLKFSSVVTFIIVALIALDPSFNQCLHSGRMDFLTLFFFLVSYLVFVKINDVSKPVGIVSAALVGVMLAAALLTTPRIIFAFSFYACYFVYEIAGKQRNLKALLLKYGLVSVGFVAVYYLWIYVAFGNVGNCIYYYKHSAVIKEHTGIDLGIRTIKYNLLIYIFSIMAFLLLVRTRLVKKNIDFVLLTLPPIVSFLVLVTGGLTGRYFALAAPFTYLLLAGVTVGLYHSAILRNLTYVIAGLFAVVFVFKGVYIFGTLQQHDPHRNEAMISQHISKNSLVAGDFRYYYIARHNDCSFLSIEQNGNWDEMIKYMLEHKVNYFIVNKDNGNRELFDRVLLSNKYQLEAVVDDNNNSGFFHKVIMKLPYKISENYSCYIYKYIGG